MCDFKPGDEVVCVDAKPRLYPAEMLKEGAVYTVTCVLYGHLVELAEARHHPDTDGFWADRFRKVQRRKTDLSIESFLTIKPGFEEPRRVTTPTRKKETAQ